MSEDEIHLDDWSPVKMLDRNNLPAVLTDIDSTPPHLKHHDFPHQSEILEGILDQCSTIKPGDVAGFHHAPVKGLTVSCLRKEYEKGQKGLAMRNFRSRHQVVFEVSDMVPPDFA
jgi:hypothetical protein